MAYVPKLTGGKRLLIDKANASMMLVIGVTSFIVVFSLVASRALLSQSGYQSRVLKERQKALKQLKDNNSNVSSLVASYKSFASEPQNVLGGSPSGSGPRDGDNPKIVLDALPSKYDFPGLISSVEKVLKEGGYNIDSIGGNDDEIAQQNTASDKPVPIEMPFPVTVTTTQSGAENLLTTLEKSIRPMYIKQMTIQVSQGNLKMSMSVKSFYQPEKTLKVSTKVIK
jgi:hypothetical protein